uniref:RFX-type winged-helix domain-containing protein n=1 Tax=Panagrolaimus superbus TaxID=310955 RepID=A0A914YAJ3_9BILA
MLPSKTRSSSVSSDFINVVDIDEEDEEAAEAEDEDKGEERGDRGTILSSEIIMEYDCYWPSSTASFSNYNNNNKNHSKHYQPVQSPGDFQGNYILQTQQNSPMSIDGDEANSLSHTARTSPATLIWLSENYEPCEGSSLPRCTLYTHYKRHCAECALDPVNPASFGKLIRSVFRGLKTRRLGTRGNSKYHYYGIRIKPNSQYINEVENDRHMIKHGRRSDVQQQLQQQQQSSSSNGYATRAATAAAAANNNGGGGGGSNGSQSSASPSSTILPVPPSGSSLNG